MRSHSERSHAEETSSYRELLVLSELHRDAVISQRQLSRRVGIALGLTNVLLRNLAAKGYIRITHAGWRRWFYTLTPAGFSRKIDLTVGYVRRFIDNYRTIRQTLREELAPFGLNAESRIAIYSTGELAELVYLELREIGIEEIDVFAPRGQDGHKFLGMPVYDVATLRPEQYDRVVVALLSGAEEGCVEVRQQGVEQGKLITFFTDRELREQL